MSDAAVIVTGAAGGLGSATVAALARRGASVLAVDLDEQALGEALPRDVAGTVVAHTADVGDEAAVGRIVTAALDRLGGLTAVFNNAAIEGPIGKITEMTVEDFDRVQRVNVRSVWLMMKHALPHLLARGGGAILNTASTGGLMGWPEISPYVASKHAVVGLTRAVALEVAGTGVRINALCPGPLNTRMIWAIGEVMAPGDRARQQEMFEGTIPVGRLGRPEEAAAFATWLLLDGPEYLTGAALPIDGAQTAG